MQHFHLDKVENFVGFATTNIPANHYAFILVKATLTSDDIRFYSYIDQLYKLYFSHFTIPEDQIYQFLVLIHEDLSADVYANDLPIILLMLPKQPIQKGDLVKVDDIADIRSLSFHNIQILTTDKILFCCKIGWKFSLFFDSNQEKALDLNKVYSELGNMYKNLKFEYVYKTIQTEPLYQEMKKDGWFPFIRIIGSDFQELIDMYSGKFNFDERISGFLDRFDNNKIQNITNSWWSNSIFSEKKQLITAGIKAYWGESQHPCIKTLATEIEGILRIKYYKETNQGKGISINRLLEYLLEKAQTKTDSDSSLFFQLPFIEYLKDQFFADFNIENGNLPLTRHSVAHGVALQEDYTRQKALQTILTLDQIFFYLT
jgi:hypothetical protein